jgi:hypothetical protein
MLSSVLCTCSLVDYLLFGCYSSSPIFLTCLILFWTVNKFSSYLIVTLTYIMNHHH